MPTVSYPPVFSFIVVPRLLGVAAPFALRPASSAEGRNEGDLASLSRFVSQLAQLVPNVPSDGENYGDDNRDIEWP